MPLHCTSPLPDLLRPNGLVVDRVRQDPPRTGLSHQLSEDEIRTRDFDGPNHTHIRARAAGLDLERGLGQKVGIGPDLLSVGGAFPILAIRIVLVLHRAVEAEMGDVVGQDLELRLNSASGPD